MGVKGYGQVDRQYGDLPQYRRYNPGREARDRDSRDMHRAEDKQKPVPGLVSDPNAHLREIESAIQRGQRESILRMQSGSGIRATQDVLTEYRQALPTISRPYYSPSLRSSNFGKLAKRTLINPGFLAFIPGLTGLGLLVVSIVLVPWSVEIDHSRGINNSMVTTKGLFQKCDTTNFTTDCVALTKFNINSIYDNLGQAARGLVVISGGLSLIFCVVCVIFGINKCSKRKGNCVVGFAYALAGLCAAAGMGCYTALLVNDIRSSTAIRYSFPGMCYYFGWAGAVCLVMASIISFLAHCARPKYTF